MGYSRFLDVAVRNANHVIGGEPVSLSDHDLCQLLEGAGCLARHRNNLLIGSTQLLYQSPSDSDCVTKDLLKLLYGIVATLKRLLLGRGFGRLVSRELHDLNYLTGLLFKFNGVCGQRGRLTQVAATNEC